VRWCARWYKYIDHAWLLDLFFCCGTTSTTDLLDYLNLIHHCSTLAPHPLPPSTCINTPTDQQIYRMKVYTSAVALLATVSSMTSVEATQLDQNTTRHGTYMYLHLIWSCWDTTQPFRSATSPRFKRWALGTSLGTFASVSIYPDWAATRSTTPSTVGPFSQARRRGTSSAGLAASGTGSSTSGMPDVPPERALGSDTDYDSTTNDQGGKCAVACAIDAMLLDTGEFCSNSPSICCYAGEYPLRVALITREHTLTPSL